MVASGLRLLLTGGYVLCRFVGTEYYYCLWSMASEQKEVVKGSGGGHRKLVFRYKENGGGGKI